MVLEVWQVVVPALETLLKLGCRIGGFQLVDLLKMGRMKVCPGGRRLSLKLDWVVAADPMDPASLHEGHECILSRCVFPGPGRLVHHPTR